MMLENSMLSEGKLICLFKNESISPPNNEMYEILQYNEIMKCYKGLNNDILHEFGEF